MLKNTTNSTNQKKIIVAVSGRMGPLHIGYIRLFQEAKKLGDQSERHECLPRTGGAERFNQARGCLKITKRTMRFHKL
jgi:hypothetical protein